MVIKDFPKIESPFEREEIKDIGYVCIPKFKREFSWILNKNICIPTEKFDGTNVSVVIQDGKIVKVLNRTNIIDLWKAHEHFFNGVKQSVEEQKFVPDFLEDGQYFGELIGKHLNGNPLEIEKSIWLPFDYIKTHYCFRFYSDWLDEKKLDDKSSDKELYEAFRELFDSLKSLWFRKRKIERQPEGIVFWNKETGEMCKLRVDMWDTHKGLKHKEILKSK